MCTAHIAVSYTHLDVYKRQAHSIAHFPAYPLGVGAGLDTFPKKSHSGYEAVPYSSDNRFSETRDVYKRQDNAFNVIWIFINAESYSPTVATLFVSLDISIQPRYRPVHSRIRQ